MSETNRKTIQKAFVKHCFYRIFIGAQILVIEAFVLKITIKKWLFSNQLLHSSETNRKTLCTIQKAFVKHRCFIIFSSGPKFS